MKTLIFAAGLSDNHNLIGTMLRFLFARPKKIFYCCYKIFDNEKFKAWLKKNHFQCQNLNRFIFHLKSLLTKLLLWKRKMLSNYQPFVIKILCLAILNISKLKSDSQFPKKFLFICFNESPLKMMKIAFYSILKALFVLKIFKFLFWHFGHVEKTA